jgi:transposase
MRTQGSPEELEHRRRLAVQRLLEGYPAEEVAEFLDVSTRTVWRWLALFRAEGSKGLTARPVPGRPCKLTSTQEKIILRWLRHSPTVLGFATELWSAPRLAQLIEQEFDIRFNPHSLSAWLRDRGFTPIGVNLEARSPRKRGYPFRYSSGFSRRLFMRGPQTTTMANETGDPTPAGLSGR